MLQMLQLIHSENQIQYPHSTRAQRTVITKTCIKKEIPLNHEDLPLFPKEEAQNIPYNMDAYSQKTLVRHPTKSPVLLPQVKTMTILCMPTSRKCHISIKY